MKFNLLLIFCFSLILKNVDGQDDLLQNIQISLITCDPGGDVSSIFGHSAVRLFDPVTEVDEVYNYGTFSSYEDGFLLKFLRGKLLYSLGVNTYGEFLGAYEYFKRGVKEEEILLPPESKVRFIKFLRNNALPENSKYLYDFFYDNCSTRIQVGIDQSVDYNITYPQDDGLTFRQMINQYLGNLPWTKFGIDLIIASRSDKLTGLEGQMFLPDHLSELLSKTKIEGQENNLLGNARIILDHPNRLDAPAPLPWPFIIFTAIGLLLWLLFYSKQYRILRITNNVISIVLGIASLVAIFMWFGTDHQATKINYNIIWLSPLYLILPFVEEKKILIYTLGALTLLCLLPILPQVMPLSTLLILILSLLATYHLMPSKNQENGV